MFPVAFSLGMPVSFWRVTQRLKVKCVGFRIRPAFECHLWFLPFETSGRSRFSLFKASHLWNRIESTSVSQSFNEIMEAELCHDTWHVSFRRSHRLAQAIISTTFFTSCNKMGKATKTIQTIQSPKVALHYISLPIQTHHDDVFLS